MSMTLSDFHWSHWEIGKVEGCPQPNEDIRSSWTSSLSWKFANSLVSVQTCAIPPHMKDRASRIFILLLVNVLSCIVTAILMEQTPCSALSLLPSKLSGSAALAPLEGWLPVGIFIKIACTTADTSLAAASETLVWASIMWSSRAFLAIWSWVSCWNWLWKSAHRNGCWVLATPSILLWEGVTWWCNVVKFNVEWDCLDRAWSSVRATLQQFHSFNQRYSEWGKLIGYEHTNTPMQWLSSVYNKNIKYRRQDFTWCSGYPQRSNWGEPTASDELYSCLGWRPWVESELIIGWGWG